MTTLKRATAHRATAPLAWVGDHWLSASRRVRLVVFVTSVVGGWVALAAWMLTAYARYDGHGQSPAMGAVVTCGAVGIVQCWVFFSAPTAAASGPPDTHTSGRLMSLPQWCGTVAVHVVVTVLMGVFLARGHVSDAILTVLILGTLIWATAALCAIVVLVVIVIVVGYATGGVRDLRERSRTQDRAERLRLLSAGLGSLGFATAVLLVMSMTVVFWHGGRGAISLAVVALASTALWQDLPVVMPAVTVLFWMCGAAMAQFIAGAAWRAVVHPTPIRDAGVADATGYLPGAQYAQERWAPPDVTTREPWAGPNVATPERWAPPDVTTRKSLATPEKP